MADVNIITPVLPGQAVSVVTQHGQEAGVSVVISGTIIGKDTNGNFLLKTQNGNVSLQSNFPLTYNSDVVIKLGSEGNSGRIVSVNGEAFSQFSQPQQPQTDSVSGSLLSGTLQTSSAQSGNTSANTASVPATVVSTAPAATENAAQPQSASATPQLPLPTGTEVIIHLPQTPPPAGQPAQLQVSTQQFFAPQQTPGEQNPQQPQAQPENVTTVVENITKVPSPQLPAQPVSTNTNFNTTGTVTKTAQPTNTQAQAQLQGTIIQEAIGQTEQTAPNPLYAAYAKNLAASELPSGNKPSAPSPASSPPQPTTTQGQVLSTGKDGTVVIQTSSSLVTLKAEAPVQLAPGTTVTIELADAAGQAAIQQRPSSPPASFAEIASSWNTLKEIVTVLNQSAAQTTVNSGTPQTAGRMIAHLPELGGNFVASSLSFISALARGDAKKLLGDDVISTLQKNGRLDLIQKFTSELATLANALSAKPELPAQNWQTAFLPFVYQGEVQQARIYVKKDALGKKQSGDSSVSGTRFVIEVDLSELGGVQMDGLVRQKQANTIFDLMIRSNSTFSSGEQAEITSIYNNAAEATGFSGKLSFQVTSVFPVKPLDDILANQTNAILV